MSFLGSPRYRRHGVRGARDGARSEGRDRRRSARDAGVPRVALALILLALACRDAHRASARTAVAAPAEENFAAIDSPSLQFLPRGQESPGWALEEDPIVVPGNRLAVYLNRDAVHFTKYEALDVTAGKYKSTKGDGFAIVEIFRFPDFVKAFGAYSTRKQDNSRFVDIANEAYVNKHSIHLWRGPFYVRVIGGAAPEGAAALQRLMLSVADRMPAAPGKPAVFNFFPVANRVPNSERYSADSGFGQAFLGNSFQASFAVNNARLDGLIIPAASKVAATKILDAYRTLYVRNGKLLDPIPNLGEDNFTAEDKYLGRAVAFRIDRFVIAFNGFDDRQKLVDLAAATDQRILGSIKKQLLAAQ